MANVKLSAIASGGAINAGTDTVVAVRNGTTDVLVTPTSGTVTTASVVSANGFAGTVATATTTPAITISTSVTGVLKGNGTAISAATAGTDYQVPITLTTTGTSGAATFTSNTLNIPQYAGTTYTASTGLTLTAGAFSITNTAVTATSYGSSTSIPSFTVNAQGQLTAAAGNVVIAPAGTLTGTTLASNVVTSSLTSVGTLTNLTVTNPISGSVTGNAGTVTTINSLIIAGTNITITGSGTSGSPYSIAASGGGSYAPLPQTVVSATSASAAVNNGYIANNAALCTITMPSTATVGQLVQVSGQGAGGWAIAQNSGQSIIFNTNTTTVGVGGSLASTHISDNVLLMNTVANTTWLVISSQGNINGV